ncbi:MAG: pantetheine-phosphate adenylyltransferase [Treponemataceae bacterium]|nr:pantetheine-phosphate adenylyltransferase [Treponemataceae bacterium]
MLRAGFPGSFDPPTYGHLDVIQRAAKIFDELTVVIAVNREKRYLFSPEERHYMIKQLVKDLPNVRVDLCDILIVRYLREHHIPVMVRGVRGVADFSYEFDISMINKGLDPDIETLFLTTDPRYFVVRSSVIKELASFGGDVSTMVPPLVAEMLKNKYDKRTGKT